MRIVSTEYLPNLSFAALERRLTPLLLQQSVGPLALGLLARDVLRALKLRDAEIEQLKTAATTASQAQDPQIRGVS